MNTGQINTSKIQGKDTYTVTGLSEEIEDAKPALKEHKNIGKEIKAKVATDDGELNDLLTSEKIWVAYIEDVGEIVSRINVRSDN